MIWLVVAMWVLSGLSALLYSVDRSTARCLALMLLAAILATVSVLVG